LQLQDRDRSGVKDPDILYGYFLDLVMTDSKISFKTFYKVWEQRLIKDAEYADYNLTKYIFNLNLTAKEKPTNKGGRPKGRKKSTIKRNAAIELAYSKLRIKGYTAKASKEKLAKKYGLAVSTIDTILKRG